MIILYPYVNIILNMLTMLNIKSISLLLTCDLKWLHKDYVWVLKDTKQIHYRLKV